MLNPKGKIVGLFGPRGELPAAVSFQESAAVTHKGSHGPIPHGCQLTSKSAGLESFFFCNRPETAVSDCGRPETTGQTGDCVWSIRADPFFIHHDHVTRCWSATMVILHHTTLKENDFGPAVLPFAFQLACVWHGLGIALMGSGWGVSERDRGRQLPREVLQHVRAVAHGLWPYLDILCAGRGSSFARNPLAADPKEVVQGEGDGHREELPPSFVLALFAGRVFSEPEPSDEWHK